MSASTDIDLAPDAAPLVDEQAARRLRGAQKAAVLLVALGKDKAGDVFKHLTDGEIEQLSL